MVPALKRRGDFIKALLKALQRLRLKCCAENAQDPYQGPALHVIELVSTHLAIHLAGFLDDAWQSVECMADARTLGVVVIAVGRRRIVFFVVCQSSAILMLGVSGVPQSHYAMAGG
jgi:hypothetical protein